MNEIDKNLLGIGPAYPHSREGGGKFPIASGTDLVGMGIEQFVLTPKGSRMMEKGIGSTFGNLVFKLEGTQREKALLELTKRDLPFFEPRAIVTDLKIDTGENGDELYVTIFYQDITTGVTANRVVKIPTTSAGV